MIRKILHLILDNDLLFYGLYYGSILAFAILIGYMMG